MPPMLKNVLPFLRWFPMSAATLRSDLVAGVSVAFVLVPQCMAYAMLAGLPVVYGLYAALVPVAIAALFGNFYQLHTGPVAMLALMSAAAVTPLALAGSDEFIALSILLSLMVGVLLLLMGALNLGVIANLVSHPVMVGFANAAAIIIALSQLRFFMNVPNPGTGSFAADITTLLERLDQAYLPAVLFGAAAGLLIWALSRWLPKLPSVLAAVVLGTAISAAIGYEQRVSVEPVRIADAQVSQKLDAFQQTQAEIKRLNEQADLRRIDLRQAQDAGLAEPDLMVIRAEIEVMEARIATLRTQNNLRRLDLHAMPLVKVQQPDGPMFYAPDKAPAEARTEAGQWRFQTLKDGQAVLAAGGNVVGTIPDNLPSFQLPPLSLASVWELLPSAVGIALIAFIMANVLSRTLAARSYQRVSPNKELYGQGMANVVGSFFQGFVVGPSFSRSAVGARAGARTGLFAVVSALVVLLVLLFLTPLLYHLPQSVLAAIVMMAVFDLIRISPLIHAWKVQRSDAIIGVTTFVATLAFAPAIYNALFLGLALTAVVFLVRTMKPRTALIGRREDGSMAGVEGSEREPIGRNFIALRFDRSLTYLTVSAFEDAILGILADHPKTRAILVIGSGINEIDASGEDKIRETLTRLRQMDVVLMFSSLKRPVAEAFGRTGLNQLIGAENLFSNKEMAVAQARARFDTSDAPSGQPHQV